MNHSPTRSSPSPTTKAVSILDTAEEISLPPAATTPTTAPVTAYKPSHLLRRPLSSKRLQGRVAFPSPSPIPATAAPTATSTPPSAAAATSVAIAAATAVATDGDQLSSSSPTAVNASEDYLFQPAQAAPAAQDAASAAASAASDLLDKCALWLETERSRRIRRRLLHRHHHHQQQRQDCDVTTGAAAAAAAAEQDSGDESLDQLEALLAQRPSLTPPSAPALSHPTSCSSSRHHSRRNSRRKSRSLLPAGAGAAGPSSDTEYASDGDAVVPGCEEWLQIPEEIGLDAFKLEVLKLAHTLRCKGWRRVDLARSCDVGISRISGALTNAVYMVTPPEAPAPSATPNGSATGPSSSAAPRQPPKLLLRIYGPQASHLIDRETELCILQRLARQKIGPRLLGTFENGRFEEFFIARTLTKEDIRVPDTSRHIAKRLKELHEGIDLEPLERAQGPIAWKNWDKWVLRCSAVMAHVEPDPATTGPVARVCGSSWADFRAHVDRYRRWLVQSHYGGDEALNRALVFAHNDAQYGNILRLQAEGKSPLLLPSNEHRQLVVIDFEYASANTPGFEFANHFCEWMADYHDPAEPWRLRERRYPTDAEMRNFLRAYVEHSLHCSGSSSNDAGTEPQLFNLDVRLPAETIGRREQERRNEVERQVDRLLAETRAWRAASSAMWAAWGIVQAKVASAGPDSAPVDPASSAGEADGQAVDEEEEFDYLRYAQQRALLFWGDCLSLGIFTPDELEALEPGLVERAKIIM